VIRFNALCSCPVLLVTGQQSIFNGTTRGLHQAILKTCDDKTKVEFIEVGGVANVLEEKVFSCPWMAECVMVHSAFSLP